MEMNLLLSLKVMQPVIYKIETDKQGYYFQSGNTERGDDWVISGVFCRADLINLDNSVDNRITSALLSGTSLKMVIPQYHTITQTFNTGGGEINMNIVKSASKLSNAFITLYPTTKNRTEIWLFPSR